jgi:hypothetical protein
MMNKRRHRYARIANYAELKKEQALLSKRIAQNQRYFEAQNEALATGIDKFLSFWPLALTAYQCFRYFRKRRRQG